MLQEGVLQRFEIFVAASLVASHAHSDEGGFRQRDVRFLIELFSNWLESHLGAHTLPIQSTQVMRYLQDLLDDGYLRKIQRNKVPHYRVTRTGLIELLSRMVEREHPYRQEEFLFTFYFIKSYRPRIVELVAAEGRNFPPALRVELESLLDVAALIARERQRVRKELRQLDERILNGKQTTSLVRKHQSLNTPPEQVIAEVQQRYPYDLNSQKPLVELFDAIPAPYRLWELTVGTECRVNDLWTPLRRNLAAYLEELEKLAEGTC